MSVPADRTTASGERLGGGQEGEHASIGQLLGRVANDLSTLLRQEISLAKAELRQTASNAGKGVGMLGGAGVAGHFVLLFLSISLWWGLGDALGRAWAGLIVALVWAVIAAVLAVVGRKELQNAKGAPQTVESLKQIPNAAKGHEEDNR